MKKLFLLLSTACVAFGANAQSVNHGVPFAKQNGANDQQSVSYGNPVHVGRSISSTSANSNQKTTAASPRWYSHYDVVNAITGNALDANDALLPLWYDSTVKQRFSTGLGTINYSSVAQVIDPITSKMFNDASYASEMKVENWDNYSVDSIFINAAYVKEKLRSTSIVDTLILSVVPQDNITYYLKKSDYPGISQYTTGDTLWAQAPTVVDSINKAAFPPASGGARAFWKVPLTDAMRDTALANGNVTVRTFTFAVPGGLSVSAGKRFAITATFKSGDVWTANVDSFSKFHHFMPITAAVTANGAMPYYYTQYSDRSMSSLMFSTNIDQYSPAIFIETWNANSFNREFINMGGYVSCNTCHTVGVQNLTNITAVSVYPNPATTEVRIKYALKAEANVNVTIANTVGQIVKSQNAGKNIKGEVSISTADLANGMYIYTVEADGQRQTGRVVVAN